MVKLAAFFFLSSIAFAGVTATRGGSGDDYDACPKGFKLQHVRGFQWGGCECVDEFYKSAPLMKGWSVSAVPNRKGGWECRPKCDEPPKPTPSGSPGHGGDHGGPGGHGGHGGHGGDHEGHGEGHEGHGGHGGHGPDDGDDKPGHSDDKPGHGNGNSGHGHWKRRQRQSLELCPKNTLACQINIPGIITSGLDVECVHPQEDLNNCGACGNSCVGAIGVKGTACVAGKCEIYSCAPGFQLRTLADGWSICQSSL